MKFVLYTDRLIELAACDNGELMYRLCFNPLNAQQVNYRVEYYDCFMYLMCERNEEMLSALRTKTKEELTLKQWTSVLADLNRGTMARRGEFNRVKRIAGIAEMVQEFKQFQCVGVDAVRLAAIVQSVVPFVQVDEDIESDEESVVSSVEDVGAADIVSESVPLAVVSVNINDEYAEGVFDRVRRAADRYSLLHKQLTEAIGARRGALDRIDELRADVEKFNVFIGRADEVLESVEESGLPAARVRDGTLVDDDYANLVLLRSSRASERFVRLQDEMSDAIAARRAALARIDTLNGYIGRVGDVLCGEKRLFSESSNDSL